MPQHDATASLTFYPAYCFSASPTYHVWVKLTGAKIQALQERRGYEGQNLFFHLNHPIQWVQAAGIVVALGDTDKYLLCFYVDDGSGTLIEVVIPREKPSALPEAQAGEVISLVPDTIAGVSDLGNRIDFKTLQVGMLVKVKGAIRKFRGEKQMWLERLFILDHTSSEQQFWADTASFFASILSVPWTLGLDEQRKLKQREIKATRLLEQKRAKKSILNAKENVG